MDRQGFDKEIQRIVIDATQVINCMEKEEYRNFYGDYECHGFASACASSDRPALSFLGRTLNELLEVQYGLEAPDEDEE